MLIVAGVFGFALPRVASYGAVWDSLRAMTWPWLGVIGLTAVASLVTTWLMIAAVIPSLRLRNAATVNLGSSAVANTVPGRWCSGDGCQLGDAVRLGRRNR